MYVGGVQVEKVRVSVIFSLAHYHTTTYADWAWGEKKTDLVPHQNPYRNQTAGRAITASNPTTSADDDAHQATTPLEGASAAAMTVAPAS